MAKDVYQKSIELDEKWNELYLMAKKVLNPRTISENVDAGGVAAAILTKNKNMTIITGLNTIKTIKLIELMSKW